MSTSANDIVRALTLGLGFLALAALILFNVARNPLTSPDTQIDEQAHLSYALHLIHSDRWWPDLEQFTMFHRTSETPLTDINYLNHPPTFYWLAKLARAANPALTTDDFRKGSLLVTLAGLALYSVIGWRLGLGLLGTATHAIMPLLVYLHMQVGFYNNDSFAMLGGMLVALASLRWFGDDHRASVWWLAMLGLTFTSVKLTAFMLVGLYVAACVLLNPRGVRMLGWPARIAALVWLAVLLAPFAYFIHYTGSPAPETLGQLKLMTPPTPGDDWSRVLITGWVHEPRMDFLHWLASFLRDFGVQVTSGDTTFIPPLLLFICLLHGTFGERSSPNTILTRMLRACLIATLITLCIHTWFAWGRYQRFGWRLDSGLRYYFPLLALYGAGCAHAFANIGMRRDTA